MLALRKGVGMREWIVEAGVVIVRRHIVHGSLADRLTSTSPMNSLNAVDPDTSNPVGVRIA